MDNLEQTSILEENKEVVLEYHKFWSGGKIDNLDDILTSDLICHCLTSIECSGIEQAKNAIRACRTIFPDWHEEIVDIMQEKDKVVMRYKVKQQIPKRTKELIQQRRKLRYTRFQFVE